MRNDLISKNKYFIRFASPRFTSRLFPRLHSIIPCFISRPLGFLHFKSVFYKSSPVQSSPVQSSPVQSSPYFSNLDDDVISLPLSFSSSAQEEFR